MTTPTAEYRSTTPRAVWMSARARNAMHRPAFIGAVSIVTFVAALVSLVVMPYQAQRAAKAIAPRPGERPDTAPLFAAAAVSRTRLVSAESALAVLRAQSRAIAAALAADTLSPELAARRDTMSARLAELNELLARVENAPLTTSYRALGEARELQQRPAVRALLDTLAAIEREREGQSASGGVDPVFVALTSRATEIGRAIQAYALQRRDTLTQELQGIAAAMTRPGSGEAGAMDTTENRLALDTARAAWQRDSTTLASTRDVILQIDAREQRARELATRTAPPLALLAAALVFGVVLGFGTALAAELRRPRIADEHEAERVAGVRVISVVQPRPPAPERQRRQADRANPPYIDPGADGHQLLYLHLASSTNQLLMLTLTGDDPVVAAVVAVNCAANAADEARNTLVIDTNAAQAPVAAALRVAAEPGIVELIDGKIGWPEATGHVTIGRNRTIDVVPSGTGAPLPDYDEVSALLERDAARLARHYDAIIVTAAEDQVLSGLPGRLPVPNVVYCARVGRTRLSTLRQAIEGIRLAGGRPLGVVLWDGELPEVMSPQELAARPRQQRTTEMQALSTSR